jgi:hypothetical protein
MWWARRTVLVIAGAVSMASSEAKTLTAAQRQRAAGAQREESNCNKRRQA